MPRLLALLALLLAAAAPARPETLPHQGIARTYSLHPAEAGPPRPLVLALHGLNQPVAAFRASWTLDRVAEREGFLIAYPEALERWAYHPARPVPLPGRDGTLDDLGFLAALLDRLVAEGRADPARLYVAGGSRGGLLAWSMACRMAGRLAGAAPLITPMIAPQLEDCAPTRPLPILALAGTEDRVQPYDGWLYQAEGYRQASMAETLEFWRRRHGCTGQDGKLLPALGGSAGTRVMRVAFTGCAANGAVQLLRVAAGGHILPTLAAPDRPRPGLNRDIETAEEIWRFFAEAWAGRRP